MLLPTFMNMNAFAFVANNGFIIRQHNKSNGTTSYWEQEKSSLLKRDIQSLLVLVTGTFEEQSICYSSRQFVKGELPLLLPTFCQPSSWRKNFAQVLVPFPYLFLSRLHQSCSGLQVKESYESGSTLLAHRQQRINNIFAVYRPWLSPTIR